MNIAKNYISKARLDGTSHHRLELSHCSNSLLDCVGEVVESKIWLNICGDCALRGLK